MKVLVRNLQTGLYLGKGKQWLKKPGEALAFLNEIRAQDHRIYHRLQHTAVVVLPDDSRSHDEPPAPALVARTGEKPQNTENMKTKSIQTHREVKAKPMTTETVQTKPKPKEEARETKAAKPKATRKKSVAPAAHPIPEAPRPLPAPITTIEAKVDVGLGNSVYIRGQGNGLTWEKGEPLICMDGSTWSWCTTKAQDKIAFKLLINDAVWSQGENLFAEAGKKTEVVPAF